MKYSILFVVLRWRLLKREAMMKKTKDLVEMQFRMILDTSPSLTIVNSKEPFKFQCRHRVTPKVTLSSPDFGPPFTTYPIFQWYTQSKDILLMKCCNSVRNAETQHLMHKVREYL
jgi:hypothetical protein